MDMRDSSGPHMNSPRERGAQTSESRSSSSGSGGLAFKKGRRVLFGVASLRRHGSSASSNCPDVQCLLHGEQVVAPSVVRQAEAPQTTAEASELIALCGAKRDCSVIDAAFVQRRVCGKQRPRSMRTPIGEDSARKRWAVDDVRDDVDARLPVQRRRVSDKQTDPRVSYKRR